MKLLCTIAVLVLASALFAEDFEYNTTGVMDEVPTTGGSHDGWGEWFITSVYNNTGSDLLITELAFPCCGPPTDVYGWIVWLDVGGLVPPAGDVTTCDYYGEFEPVDPDPETFPPTTYTYIDIESANVVIPAGNYFCFGYDNTGNGGQIDFNGVDTWAWYGDLWDGDQAWGRTAILQIKANFFGALDQSTWGNIKISF